MNLSNLNPESILENIKLQILSAVKDRHHGFHTPIFSHIKSKLHISSKMVVLRKFNEKKFIINFHTDYRSKKISEISNFPQTYFVFYDSKLKVQLRLETVSKINHLNDIALREWENTKLSSRKCYLAKKAPSSISPKASDSLPDSLKGVDPSSQQSEEGYNNFAVVENKIKTIDWLSLKSSGHRRILINLNENDKKYQWIIP